VENHAIYQMVTPLVSINELAFRILRRNRELSSFLLFLIFLYEQAFNYLILFVSITFSSCHQNVSTKKNNTKKLHMNGSAICLISQKKILETNNTNEQTDMSLLHEKYQCDISLQSLQNINDVSVNTAMPIFYQEKQVEFASTGEKSLPIVRPVPTIPVLFSKKKQSKKSQIKKQKNTTNPLENDQI
jgi:hypothetical protein